MKVRNLLAFKMISVMMKIGIILIKMLIGIITVMVVVIKMVIR